MAIWDLLSPKGTPEQDAMLEKKQRRDRIRRAKRAPPVTTQPVTGTTSPATGAVVDGNNGLLIPMKLSGDSIGEAVYSIPLIIGHRINPITNTPNPPVSTPPVRSDDRPASSNTQSSSSSLSSTGSSTSNNNTNSNTNTNTRTGTSATLPVTSNSPLFATGPAQSSTTSTTGTTSSATSSGGQAGPSARAVDWRGRQRSAAGRLGVRAGESDYQTLDVQVDLGSSDLWVASSSCSTLSCNAGGPTKYNAGAATDSGKYANLNYQAGSVSGSIYWDDIQLGVNVTTITTAVNGTGGGGANGFDVGFQAFIAADQVNGEDLNGGKYSGILGLALPANSVISSIIPGSTSGQPDGATFLDNLFASGTTAPQGRFFSMSLERLGDSRTKSVLGLGMHDSTVCLDPCTPSYSSIVSASTGPLFWRLPVNGISTTVWGKTPTTSSLPSDPTTVSIPLPASATTSQSWPVGVLDSGGSQMLFGSRQLLNAIYGSYGVGPASDGNYYVPCNTEIAIGFTFGSTTYAVHPLDMSDFMSTDLSHKTCLGSMQYASGITAGDIVLGSSFLKNVYSVFTYPAIGSTTLKWNPQVGLVSLTNATQASQEFHNVRTMNLPLTSPNTAATPTGTPAAAASGGRVVSAGLIALGAILGTVALAGGAFCAWWFWLRRKHGKGGKVDDPAYEAAPTAGNSARRSAKFVSMQRQKSMVDGYSDYDVDSWGGETGTENSRGSRDVGDLVGDEEKLSRSESGRLSMLQTTPSSKQVAFEGSYPPPSVWGQNKGHRDKSPSNSTIRTLLYASSPSAEMPMLSPEDLAAASPDYSRYSSIPLPSSPTRKPLLAGHGNRDSSGSSADYFPPGILDRRRSRVASATPSEEIEMRATEKRGSAHSKLSMGGGGGSGGGGGGGGGGGDALGPVVEDGLTEEPRRMSLY